MKNISIILILCITSIHAMCQDSQKFKGHYVALEEYKVISGEGYGYEDTITRNFEIIPLSDSIIILKHFYDLDSLKAIVKSDSFFIYSQKFNNESGTIIGKGKIANDTINYHYIIQQSDVVTSVEVEFYGMGHRYYGNKIEEQEIKNNLNCYPNPFSNTTYVKFSIPANIKSAILNIYNVNNVLVKSICLAQRGKFIQTIDGAELESGLYFCVIEFNNEVKNRFKILKI